MSHKLTVEGEESWQELKVHLEWSTEFELFIVFSCSPLVYSAFRQKLSDFYQTQQLQLITYIADNPESLVSDCLNFLRSNESMPQAKPIIIELTQLSDFWYQKQADFIARLNERRERLRKYFTKPVILVLSKNFIESFYKIAPDLWSIRTQSIQLNQNHLLIEQASTDLVTLSLRNMTEELNSQRLKKNANRTFDFEFKQWFIELIKNSNKLPYAEFKIWIMNHLQQICHCLSCEWTLTTTNSDFEHSFNVNLPIEFRENLKNISNDSAPLSHYLKSNPNRFFSNLDVFVQSQWHKTQLYQHHFAAMGIEYVLGCYIEPLVNCSSPQFIYFYRNEQQNAFSREDKKRLNYILPHLIQSLIHNFLKSEFNHHQTNLVGIINHDGYPLLAQERLATLLTENNQKITHQLQTMDLAPLAINEFELFFHSNDSYIYVEAVREDLFKKLSTKQLAIAQLIKEGFWVREITALMAISSSSVYANIDAIFSILQVNNRFELINILYNHQPT